MSGELLSVGKEVRQARPRGVAEAEAIARRERMPAVPGGSRHRIHFQRREERAHRGCAKLDFIHLGKRTGNGKIESFNGRLRDEGLNVLQFGLPSNTRLILFALRAPLIGVRRI